MSLKELGEVLGKQFQEKNKLSSHVSPPDVENTYFMRGQYFLKARITQITIEQRSIAGFILGHATYGVLGTSRLGGGNTGNWTTIETINDVSKLTNVGKYEVAKFLNSNTDADSPDSAHAPTHIAVGTSDTAFDASQTYLVDEKVRKAVTATAGTTGKLVLTASVMSTDTQAMSQTLKEVGIVLDGSASGTITSAGAQTVDIVLGTSV